MPRRTSNYRLVHSPVSGQVCVGPFRGNRLAGNLHDVGESFLEAMLSWGEANPRGGLVTGSDGNLYQVKVKVTRVRVKPAKKGAAR